MENETALITQRDYTFKSVDKLPIVIKIREVHILQQFRIFYILLEHF